MYRKIYIHIFKKYIHLKKQNINTKMYIKNKIKNIYNINININIYLHTPKLLKRNE